jgi:orotidine-5'-phosphate decarboxylase
MNSSASPLARVAVALDTPDRAEFSRWCRLFGPRVGLLKVGLEAFVRFGPSAVEEARAFAPGVFLDLKLHDIPATVAGAVRAAGALGATFLTVHAGGGPTMLRAAAQVENAPRLLAVTLLTHLDGAELERLDLPGSGPDRVASWARLAQEAGCAGVVCSPLEAARLRVETGPRFVLVTPGIRAGGGAGDDQKRTATARAALEAGADVLVIGRPLTRAADPERALDELARELAR